MKTYNKFTALLTSLILAITLASCGNFSDTKYALTIEGEKIPAGIFLYYSMAAYYDMAQIVNENGDDPYNPDNIKNATVTDAITGDVLNSKDWIQNKAVEYCKEYVAINKEFEALGFSLTAEEQEDIDSGSTSAYNQKSQNWVANGIGYESYLAVYTVESKKQKIFEFYFGENGSEGYNREQYQEHFLNTFARVKYLPVELKDIEGNLLKGEEKQELIKKVKGYVDRVNAAGPTGSDARLFEMNAIIDDYADFLEAAEEAELNEENNNAETNLEIAPTTTPANDDMVTLVVTTSTTDRFMNEKLVESITTTQPSAVEPGQTTLLQEEPNYFPTKLSNEFIWQKAPIGTAVYFEETETAYVILRLDLRERLTEDDLWSSTVQAYFLNDLFRDDFTNFLEAMASTLEVTKNSAAMKRYDPFKLDVPMEQEAQY